MTEARGERKREERGRVDGGEKEKGREREKERERDLKIFFATLKMEEGAMS